MLDLQYVVKNVKKTRLAHSKLKLKREESQGAQRMPYKCGASPAEYVGAGDRDKKFLSIFFRENISRTSKMELPYYSIDCYLIVCIYCGIGGTQRTF